MQRLLLNNKQRGTALITALFIVAICAILAVSIELEQRLLIYHTQLIVNADQAYADLQGVQYWALAELTVYKQALKQPLKNPPQLMTRFPKRKFNRMVLSGKLLALQGRFNINSLSNSANQPKFVRLLQAVDPSISTRQAITLAKNVTAWMTVQGSDDAYLRLVPPYRSAHAPMVNVTELRAVQGFNAALFTRLLPMVAALPVGGAGASSAIDINSAAAPVLLTLSSKMNRSQANALVACRRSHPPFTSTQAFNSLCVKDVGLSPLTGISTSSQYYLLKSTAEIGQQKLLLSSFLAFKSSQQNQVTAYVVWQSHAPS